MELIAVVMHAPTSNDRFESAKALLNYGFAGWALTAVYPDQALSPVPVLLGQQDTVQPVPQRECVILAEKGQEGAIATQVELAQSVEAPVEAGQQLGAFHIFVNGEQRDSIPLVAAQEVGRLGVGDLFRSLLDQLFLQETG